MNNPFDELNHKLDRISATLERFKADPEVMPDRWLTMDCFSAYTGYSKESGYKFKRNDPSFPFHQRNGKIMFRMGELDQWLESKNTNN